jgi:hypothetical protein
MPDGIAYVWCVDRNDGEQRSVRVEITGSALASDDMPSPIPESIGSKGAIAVLGVRHWTEPPEVITIGTTTMQPLPGSADPVV